MDLNVWLSNLYFIQITKINYDLSNTRLDWNLLNRKVASSLLQSSLFHTLWRIEYAKRAPLIHAIRIQNWCTLTQQNESIVVNMRQWFNSFCALKLSAISNENDIIRWERAIGVRQSNYDNSSGFLHFMQLNCKNFSPIPHVNEQQHHHHHQRQSMNCMHYLFDLNISNVIYKCFIEEHFQCFALFGHLSLKMKQFTSLHD